MASATRGTSFHLRALKGGKPGGTKQDTAMKKSAMNQFAIKFPVVLTSTILAFSGAAFAQQQYDSLGMPTSRPNQSASPSEKAPNVPVPAGQPDAGASKENSSAAGAPVENAAGGAQTTGSGSSTTSGANPATGGDSQPADAGAGSQSQTTGDPTQTPNKNGVTPSGITPE